MKQNMFIILCTVLMVCTGVHSRPNVVSLENFIGEKEYICAAKPADVIFALDTSNSIWGPDFRRQLIFVQHVVDFFIIGPENIRVGAVTFNHREYNQFDLRQYGDKKSLNEAIGNIEQYGGTYTYTDKAISYVTKKGFTKEKGAREGVTKVLIVITDGRSYNTIETARAAEIARENGIHIFAIGVGYSVDEYELKSIASEPHGENMFMVNNFSSLDRIKEVLAIKTCTVTDPPTTTTPTTTTSTTTTQRTVVFESKPTKVPESSTTRNLLPQDGRPESGITLPVISPGSDHKGPPRFDHRKGCIPKQPLDLAFIVDEKQGGSEYKKKFWNFVRNVVSKLNFEDGDIRISFIRECADIPELHLNQYSNKSRLLQHLDSIRPDSARTAGLLRAMTNKLTEKSVTDNNIIPKERKKIGVYITDGESHDLQATLREAQNAKLYNNIELFGVGVTDEINPVEMQALVSCDVDDHLLTVPTHGGLNKLYKKLAHKICKAPL